MKEHIFSKLMGERQTKFPWLKEFLRKYLKTFPKEPDSDIQKFLLQNIGNEVKSLSNYQAAKRKALFAVIYDLFLHFWWRIRCKDKRKWRRYWKQVSTNVSYTYEEHSKCCEKLLYYIIYLGIILSRGLTDSEWIEKIFKIIHILPSFNPMIYSSLLQINNLQKKYHHAYLTVLKQVLCTEIAENIAEPDIYIKIMLLFRRLKSITNDKIAKSALKSTASRIVPPKNTIQWLSSLRIGFTTEKNESIAEEILSNKYSKTFYHKLIRALSGVEDSELQRSPQREESNETESSQCKMSHSHQLNNEKNDTLKEKSFSESKNMISESELSANNPAFFEKSNMNEFLNLSFAEISNFSKNSVTEEREILQTSKENDKMNCNVLTTETISKETYAITNATPIPYVESEQSKSCCSRPSRKRIKLGAAKKVQTNKLASCSYHMKQTLPENVPFVSLVNVNKVHPSALHKLVQFPKENMTSSHCEESPNATTENKNTNHINAARNIFNTEITASESSSPVQVRRSSRLHSRDSSKVFVEKNSINHIEKGSSYSKSENFSTVVELPKENLISDRCDGSPKAAFENDNENQINGSRNIFNAGVTEGESPRVLRTLHMPRLQCESSLNGFMEKNQLNKIEMGSSFSERAKLTADSLYVRHFSTNKSDDQNFKNTRCNGSSLDFIGSACTSPASSFFGSHSSIPTVSKNLQTFKRPLGNSRQNEPINSEMRHVNVYKAAENNLHNTSISPNLNCSNCVVDYKIDKYFNPNATNKQEEIFPGKKMIRNISCITPEDASEQNTGHIFGNFSKAVTPATSENSFSSFAMSNPYPKMPKLTPFYDDPPIYRGLINSIATPPDTEVETSISSSSSKQYCPETSLSPISKQNYISSPKMTSSTIPRTILTWDSAVQTSDGEASNEWNSENTDSPNFQHNLTSPPMSPVDNILERLNNKLLKTSSEKNKLGKKDNFQTELEDDLSYRNHLNVHSCSESSDESTASGFNQSSSDDPASSCSETCHEVSMCKDASTVDRQNTSDDLKKRRKNPTPRKYSESRQNYLTPPKLETFDNNGNKQRTRSHLIKPPKLGKFF